MGDMGDTFRAYRDMKRERRDALGVNCPTCTVKSPKAQPSILLPQQRCRVCGYRDQRKRDGT